MSLGPHLAKDARLLLRNRPLLVALLAYPLLLVVVLGAAFQEPPSTLSLAVVDQEAAGATLEVGEDTLTTADLLGAARDFAHIHEAQTEEEALRLLRAGEVDAVLVVPPDFLRSLGTLGESATLRLVVDESDPVRAGVARSAVEGAVDSFVQGIVQKKVRDVLALINLTVEGGSTRVLFVDVDVLGIERARERLVEVRATLDASTDEHRKLTDVIGFLDFAQGVLGNSERYLRTTAVPLEVQAEGLAARDAKLSAIALPGALVLGVFWTGSLAAALLAARERETGAHRRLAAAPGARLAPTASKALVALAAALVPALILLLVAVPALGALVASPLLTALALVLASLAAAALGLLAAGLARGTNGAALLAVLALVPMLLLGGLFYPVSYMPAPAQVVSRALPVTLAIDALRGAMIRGSGILELLAPLAGLAAFAALAGALGWWLSARRSA